VQQEQHLQQQAHNAQHTAVGGVFRYILSYCSSEQRLCPWRLRTHRSKLKRATLWMVMEAPLDPTQRTAMELERRKIVVTSRARCLELMEDLTELDASIRDQDRSGPCCT
jgi:hypothetical protein